LAPTQRYATYYNMNHSKRGLALIFNHEFFTISHLKSRCGTNIDCQNLIVTLKNLGFEVNDYHNLIHKDIVKQLERGKLHFFFNRMYIHNFSLKNFLYLRVIYIKIYTKKIFLKSNIVL